MTLKETYHLWISHYFPDQKSGGFNSRLNSHFSLLRPLWDTDIHEICLFDFNKYCCNSEISEDSMEISRLLLKAIIEWDVDITVPAYRGAYTYHSNSFLDEIPPADIDPNELSNESTLEEVYSAWMKQNRISLSYRNCKRLDLAWKTIKDFHQYPFRLLRATDIEPYKEKCSKECYEMMNSLLARLDWFVLSLDITDTLHLHRIKRDYYNPAQYQYLSSNEIEIFFKNRNCDLIDIILVLVYTGMTLHELIEIDISRIQNNLLHISHFPTSYTRLHDRIIPLHPRIQPILRKWIEQGKPQLYINSTQYYSISYYLRNYCRLAGLALLHHEFLLKDLRYTFQINLENTSATTTQMAVLLGNKLRSVGGRVYTHPTINRLTQIINELQ